MNKRIIVLLILFSPFIAAQIETISSDHPVYNFLKKLSVRGIITNYDDIVLPVSRSRILNLLDSARKKQDKLTAIDRELITRYYEKLCTDCRKINLMANGFVNITSAGEKVLYRYSDSAMNFTLNPILDVKGIYSFDFKKSAFLFNGGGRAYGSYDNWLGFAVQASNGTVAGNRETAKLDNRIQKSFSFNETEINFFDATEGHLALKKGIFDFQIGREKILWGNGYIDRMFISENPPLFDFIRFSLSYKSFKYHFLHGWLVQKPSIIGLDSLLSGIKVKSPKYIAVNRLGIDISKKLNAGFTQAVIYSGRPVEASYLNPFLLWESSQRSLNDLDNSFLALDLRWKILNDMEFSFTYLFDDIHFGRLFEKGWNTVDNKIAIQAGLYIAPKIMPELAIQTELTILRPYTFSHFGINESLTYTNNGHFLGIPEHPNSIKFSTRFDYSINSALQLNLKLSYTVRGKNLYSQDGKLLRNYGGNIFEYVTIYDESTVYILDGTKEKDYDAGISLNWELIKNYYIMVDYIYNKVFLTGNNTINSFISIQWKLLFE